MKVPEWLKRPRRRARHVDDPDGGPASSEAPLREFVYLDEVSLRSLLSSQKGEITESTSAQSASAVEAEVSATLGANPGLVAKAELASRYQTANSSTIQTSRKATVQSWFREFHDLDGLRMIRPTKPDDSVIDSEGLKSIEDPCLVVRSDAVLRGELVEFRVRLKADPVFRLETMVSEFSGMAEDCPDMFAVGDGIEVLRQTQPIDKILQRLLAGLIPVRAEAIDYSVVVLDGVEYIAHNQLLKGLSLKTRPLEIVGVTEHLAYWRDIRRVLFSDSEFILMGRIARNDLHDTWTPVKLADLFQDVVPELVHQISAASSAPFRTDQRMVPVTSSEVRLGRALRAYADELLNRVAKKLSKTKREHLDNRIAELEKRSLSVSDQRSAFREVHDLLVELADIQIDASEDLELREKVRSSVGLPLFPALDRPGHVPVNNATEDEGNTGPRLLDVEVIAIYW